MEQTTKEDGRRGNGRHEHSMRVLKGRRRAIIVSKEQYGPGEEWESGRDWAIANGNVNKAGNVSTACRAGLKWYGRYFRYRDEAIPSLLDQVYGPVYVNAGCRE